MFYLRERVYLLKCLSALLSRVFLEQLNPELRRFLPRPEIVTARVLELFEAGLVNPRSKLGSQERDVQML